MDPNQTTGTTSSGINDVDPIGSDSGAGVTPTGLTWTNDATKTAPAQRVPPIGTSSQDRSLPINQTMVPERTVARVWNHPRDRSSSDDLTRSQSRPISPTHLAQTRGELTELREMMTTLIDEIPSQRIANKAIANRLVTRQKGARRASSCKYSGKKSDVPRSVKDDVQPPKHWTVWHSRDPKHPIRTLRRRKFATTPAERHDPPKLKL